MNAVELEARAKATYERLVAEFVRGEASHKAMLGAFFQYRALETERSEHQAQWAGCEL